MPSTVALSRDAGDNDEEFLTKRRPSVGLGTPNGGGPGAARSAHSEEVAILKDVIGPLVGGQREPADHVRDRLCEADS